VINKNGSANDVTFTVLQDLFQIPVMFECYENAKEVVSTILKYKRLYNTIKAQHLEDQIEDSQLEALCNTLKIDNLNRPFLSTIIYFDDCANNSLFKNPTQYFPQLIATCRHNGLTFFFASQFWKGMTTELKSNASTIYIFRDFSQQQVNYILQQTPLKYELSRINRIYKTMREHDKLVVDTISGTVTVDKS
jgi:hypothetical protein